VPSSSTACILDGAAVPPGFGVRQAFPCNTPSHLQVVMDAHGGASAHLFFSCRRALCIQGCHAMPIVLELSASAILPGHQSHQLFCHHGHHFAGHPTRQGATEEHQLGHVSSSNKFGLPAGPTRPVIPSSACALGHLMNVIQRAAEELPEYVSLPTLSCPPLNSYIVARQFLQRAVGWRHPMHLAASHAPSSISST